MKRRGKNVEGWQGSQSTLDIGHPSDGRRQQDIRLREGGKSGRVKRGNEWEGTRDTGRAELRGRWHGEEGGRRSRVALSPAARGLDVLGRERFQQFGSYSRPLPPECLILARHGSPLSHLEPCCLTGALGTFGTSLHVRLARTRIPCFCGGTPRHFGCSRGPSGLRGHSVEWFRVHPLTQRAE